jgi:tetratricopeptide (TPR) repeat protein
MEIVQAALRQPPDERETFVRAACGDDEPLRREVAETVTWELRMGGFLQHPVLATKEPARAFQAGQVIADRFAITRLIGEGGMGIVYESFDRKRHQRVALKFAKAGFQRLLSPELEGALTVRHPNICLVNEIHTTVIDNCELDFLTMEYVEGVTLARSLDEHGKRPQKEALEIARQLCAGVAEAHRSGVIHRDLKTGNIMLAPAAGSGLRVVIMDFGLAGVLGSDGAEGGTQGYMAPELLDGARASFRSDIYALGVILHEIVTGRLPVRESNNGTSEANPFVSPSKLVKGLDPRWDRTILTCLNTSPELRPSDASQVIASLEKRPIPKKSLATVALLLVASLAIPQVREWVKDQFWPPPNVRLAILPLVGDAKSLAMAEGVLQDVTERVRRMRSGGRTVVVIPPSEVVDRGVKTADEAHAVLNATDALEVTVKNEGNDLVTRGAVIDLATKTALRQFSGRYSTATVGSFPAALTGTISAALRLRGPVTPDTVSTQATPAYDRGLYLLRRDQQSFDGAIAAFEEAARLDPRSPLPPAALAEANIMKFEQTAQEHCLDDARKALHIAETLNPDSPKVRLAAGWLKETTSQYEGALADYRRVLEFEPRNEEVFRRMAAVYDKLQMPSDAIAQYQNAIMLDPGYYAGYHGLGVFYYYHGNYQEAAEQFQKSIDRAPGLYDEYTNLGAAFDELGRYDDAEQAFLRSLNLRETPRALNNLGAMRAYQKRDDEAVAYYARAVALDPSEYVYLENLADSYRRLGRSQEATTAYRKAMDLALAVLKQNPRLGYDRGFVAYISARLGNRRRAEDEIAQALQLSPSETKVIRNAVLTYETLGQRDRAIQVLDGAPLQLLRELDRQPDLAEFRQDPRFRKLVAQNSN